MACQLTVVLGGMMLTPKVAIIILNWNGWKDTLECLESLYQITYPAYEVIIVDNGSEDNSIDHIRDYCAGNCEVTTDFVTYQAETKPIALAEYTRDEIESGGADPLVDIPSDRKLRIIKNEKNYGCSEGNNIGMRFALNDLNADYILLLNNDVVVDREFLGEMVAVAERDEYIGFVGPKAYFYHDKGVIQYTGGGTVDLRRGVSPCIARNERDNGNYNRNYEVDYVGGACILVKREVIDTIGLWDDTFFAYWEETDWCLRGKKEGYASMYAWRANIWHKEGATSGSGLNTYFMTRNRPYFVRKHTDPVQYTQFLLYQMGFRFWYTLFLYGIYQRDITKLRYYLMGINDSRKLKPGTPSNRQTPQPPIR
ncbi:MAG TPA: glycosyltransferase family 2 protein, partial [Methanoculleus sp.]|nr:glycosyltransferase family 2 protein [Methanoculleus sp.]